MHDKYLHNLYSSPNITGGHQIKEDNGGNNNCLQNVCQTASGNWEELHVDGSIISGLRGYYEHVNEITSP
jgi:hypothetical protein